jgi:hypothetical protein
MLATLRKLRRRYALPDAESIVELLAAHRREHPTRA